MLFKKNELFNNYFVHNNKKIINIDISKLLSEKIYIPNDQRIRDDNKVNEIIIYQDKYFKECKSTNHFNFLGLINIHSCNDDGKNYLVDGQHRFKAAKELFEKHNYRNFSLNVEVVLVQNKKELKENYKIINKNTELPDFPEEINKNIPEEVAKYFFKEYSEIWKTTKKPPRPFMNKNQFQEALGFLTLKINNNNKKNNEPEIDSEDLKQIIINKNNDMSKWPLESYEKQIRKIKHWPKYKNNADTIGFYLGMYNYCMEDYCYDWCRDLIKAKCGEEIKKKKRVRKKKKIPKLLRQEVWKKHIGNTLEGICTCCEKISISISNFECGHIIAEAKGGETNINNLKPICSACNRGMGMMNLNEYKKKFYPKRKNSLLKQVTSLFTS
tara:strand:+ start:3173 stop:4324 length:1152 start_codon:yes stop_codon:yes gene_type:complete